MPLRHPCLLSLSTPPLRPISPQQVKNQLEADELAAWRKQFKGWCERMDREAEEAAAATRARNRALAIEVQVRSQAVGIVACLLQLRGSERSVRFGGHAARDEFAMQPSVTRDCDPASILCWLVK